MRIKPGGVRLGLNALQEYNHYFGDGLIGTNGVVYSAIATFGTTSLAIVNDLVDPGFTMANKSLEVGLTQMFTGLDAAFVGSITYYWEARSEYIDTATGVGTLKTGGWIPIQGTYTKGVGTLLTSEDTLSGRIPVGSLTHFPARFRLMAQGLRASVAQGKVKNTSYINAVGIVIPGA